MLCNYFRYIETHLLLCGAAWPRLAGPNSWFTSLTPFLFGGPYGSGHPDPDFRGEPVNTASMRAAAPPAGRIPLATGSRTGAALEPVPDTRCRLAELPLGSQKDYSDAMAIR